MDENATFHWPGGGTPFFTLFDGTIVHCEVHGRVPYLRSGTFGAAPPGSFSSAKALPIIASPAKVPALVLEASPLIDLSSCVLCSDRSLKSNAPPACAGEDEDELHSAFPPLPRQTAAQRAETAYIEEAGRIMSRCPTVP